MANHFRAIFFKSVAYRLADSARRTGDKRDFSSQIKFFFYHILMFFLKMGYEIWVMGNEIWVMGNGR